VSKERAVLMLVKSKVPFVIVDWTVSHHVQVSERGKQRGETISAFTVTSRRTYVKRGPHGVGRNSSVKRINLRARNTPCWSRTFILIEGEEKVRGAGLNLPERRLRKNSSALTWLA